MSLVLGRGDRRCLRHAPAFYYLLMVFIALNPATAITRLVGLLTLCACLHVHAHVGLATTVPDHDAELERAPTQVLFQFMAEVTITNVRLDVVSEAGKGKRLDVRLPRNSIGQSTAFGETIALELPALDPATYQLTYQAVSIGGDILIDDFSFTVLP